MSKREHHYRSEIVKLLRPLLAFPVENAVDVGTPDVCCLLGWIEIKRGKDVKRPDSIVQVEVKNSQHIWMRNWCRQGGPAWFLTRLDDSGLWMLHTGQWGAEHLGKVSKATLLEFALFASTDLEDGRTLTRVLMNSRNTKGKDMTHETDQLKADLAAVWERKRELDKTESELRAENARLRAELAKHRGNRI